MFLSLKVEYLLKTESRLNSRLRNTYIADRAIAPRCILNYCLYQSHSSVRYKISCQQLRFLAIKNNSDRTYLKNCNRNNKNAD